MRDSSPLLAPSTREAVPQFRRRRSRSPVSSRNQGHTPSSPVSPQVPLTPSALPQKPEWARRSTTVSSTTPKADAVSPMQDTPELVITAPVIPQYKPKQSEIELELARIQSHHASLAAAHETSVKATRRALFEVELANMDLRLAEARRSIADAQVEKARAGVLGIDYVQEIPGTVE
ncbi:hypothetical protein CERSUDRAFT_82755 [Gelatoporia subvermispora B]|uniref:Uncharacterized protein n=1 Tax=Ceriporiopsis subvermispora (strain B) TaxID=914234 RepID=M2PPQ6_CERS8|nr:hypothetical protein CERSUDRAFT_82755 [Gelatoporia subvermispora B]